MAEEERLRHLINSNYETWFFINSLYEQWAGKFGMQDNTLFVLYHVMQNPFGCTQKELCEKLVLPKQTISFVLNKLEDEGFIYREPDPSNRRNKLVKFTEYGEKTAEAILSKLEKAEIEAFETLSVSEQEIVTSSLRTLAAAIEKSFWKD